MCYDTLDEFFPIIYSSGLETQLANLSLMDVFCMQIEQIICITGDLNIYRPLGFHYTRSDGYLYQCEMSFVNRLPDDKTLNLVQTESIGR